MQNLPRNVDAAICRAANQYGCTLGMLLGKSQAKSIVAARRFAVLELRDAGYSFPEIGLFLNRHHTSIMRLIEPPKAATTVENYEIPVPDLSGEWNM